jgi:uncharacterized protein involved in exopolysaccharide biosynthesis
MSVLTIVEASKQFNVTRPRIYRAIQKGELTTALNDEGVQVVQVQDMIRLFGHQKKKAVAKPIRNSVYDTDSKLVLLLEEQLKKAEEDKAFLKQQINDLRKDFDDYKLRIEHQPRTEQGTSVTSNDHVLDNETLQIEQTKNTHETASSFDYSMQEDKPVKKSLFSRLVKEILK